MVHSPTVLISTVCLAVSGLWGKTSLLLLVGQDNTDMTPAVSIASMTPAVGMHMELSDCRDKIEARIQPETMDIHTVNFAVMLERFTWLSISSCATALTVFAALLLDTFIIFLYFQKISQRVSEFLRRDQAAGKIYLSAQLSREVLEKPLRSCRLPLQRIKVSTRTWLLRERVSEGKSPSVNTNALTGTGGGFEHAFADANYGKDSQLQFGGPQETLPPVLDLRAVQSPVKSDSFHSCNDLLDVSSVQARHIFSRSSLVELTPGRRARVCPYCGEDMSYFLKIRGFGFAEARHTARCISRETGRR